MSDIKKTSVFGNSLVWFGAAVSIAEILTGTLFAPLGFGKALAAIVLGHALGCALLYFAGLIGAEHGKSAMESVKYSYGEHGGKLFAAFNVLQLVGWTAVMIASGAQAAQSVHAFGCGLWPWAVIIGGLIIVWLLAGIGVLQKINVAVMALLFVLSLLLSKLVFADGGAAVEESPLSFGQALELSIAMPVSWLPLFADYTCNASRPRLTCATSTVVYFLVSCWMYVIGMAAAIYAGESDIAVIMNKAGFGLSAIIIVILSTVTTTFLDVYSTGVSMASITAKVGERLSAIVACVLGVLLAILFNTDRFEGFLYWIGSIFVPMATVHIMDMLVLKSRDNGQARFWRNLILWLLGFVVYRVFLRLDLPIGSTIPDVIITAVLCAIVGAFFRGGCCDSGGQPSVSIKNVNEI